LENLSHTIADNRFQIKLISMVSLLMFLFVLFFQPFDFKLEDYNDRLIFILGIGVITFIILLLFRIVLPGSVTGRIRIESIKISNEVGLILLIWLFISAANICYLTFAGNMELNLFEGVKIAMFSSIPSVILKISDVNKMLREQMKHFVRRIIRLEHELANSTDTGRKLIQFHSETQKDNLELVPDDIIYIRSADNYVDVCFRKEEGITHQLIRTTLKNVLHDLKDFPEFIRCHRTCIANMNYVLNLNNNYKGHYLIMLDIDEYIPVSRQYIINVQEALMTD